MKVKIIKGAYIYDSDIADFTKRDLFVRGDKFVSESDIDASDEIETLDLDGKYIVPGLIDVHSHGRAGCDFNRHERMDYEKTLRSYASAGTTSVLATLASDTYESLLTSIDELSEIRKSKVSKGAKVLGIHLEGRYLNPEKRGAHEISLLHAPSLSELRVICEKMSPSPMHISMAPELDGGMEFIREAVSLGATVGIAHSNADAATSKEALKNGAISFTHLYNAMRPLHHREPGNTGIALTSGAYAEVICDGYHVHPDMVKLAYLAKGKERFVLITDSMEATANGDGEYEIAGMPVTVKDGCAMTHDGAIAGSLLSMYDGVINICRFADVKYTDAILCATKAPAEMIGAYSSVGSISAGKQADFLVLSSGEVTENSAPALEKVCIDGIFIDA